MNSIQQRRNTTMMKQNILIEENIRRKRMQNRKLSILY